MLMKCLDFEEITFIKKPCFPKYFLIRASEELHNHYTTPLGYK